MFTYISILTGSPDCQTFLKPHHGSPLALGPTARETQSWDLQLGSSWAAVCTLLDFLNIIFLSISSTYIECYISDVIISASKMFQEMHEKYNSLFAPTFIHSGVLFSFLKFQTFYCYHFLYVQRTFFSHAKRMGLLATKSLCFYLPENVFVSPSFSKDIFAGYRIGG